MRALSPAASPARPPRPQRPRGLLGGWGPDPVPTPESTPAGSPAPGHGEDDGEARRSARLEALLERARARMSLAQAEGGTVRAAAAHDATSPLPADAAPGSADAAPLPADAAPLPAGAAPLPAGATSQPAAAAPGLVDPPGAVSPTTAADAAATGDPAAEGVAHRPSRPAPGCGLGWTYAADPGDGIRASAWSDRLARARARAAAPDARGEAGAAAGGASGPGPFRLAAREAAVVIGPDFGEDVFEVAPGQSLTFAFSAPPAAGLAAVEIAAEEDAMRLALADGPVLRLRGLDASGRVTLSMGAEEIELSPGAPTAAIDARI